MRVMQRVRGPSNAGTVPEKRTSLLWRNRTFAFWAYRPTSDKERYVNFWGDWVAIDTRPPIGYLPGYADSSRLRPAVPHRRGVQGLLGRQAVAGRRALPPLRRQGKGLRAQGSALPLPLQEHRMRRPEWLSLLGHHPD